MMFILCLPVFLVAVQARSPPLPDVCDLPKETGPCKASMPRFYYNQNNQRCEEFTYGGCRGNGNNFKTQIECENRCNSLKPGPNCGPVCMIHCEFGNVMDGRGCPTCKCNPSKPIECPMIHCIENCDHGYRMDRRGCQTCRCLPRPFPRPIRTGVCPKGTESNIECPIKLQHGCKSDKDCTGSKKCCTYGCTRKCVTPKYNFPIYPRKPVLLGKA